MLNNPVIDTSLPHIGIYGSHSSEGSPTQLMPFIEIVPDVRSKTMNEGANIWASVRLLITEESFHVWLTRVKTVSAPRIKMLC